MAHARHKSGRHKHHAHMQMKRHASHNRMAHINKKVPAGGR